MPQVISDYDVIVLWLGPSVLVLSITAMALRITQLTATVDRLVEHVSELAELVQTCALYRDGEQRTIEVNRALSHAKSLVNGK
jgi:hypothetical protein